MKYLFKIVKIIFLVFLITVAGLLILIFLNYKGVKSFNDTYGYYIGIAFMVILVLTILALVVAVVIGIYRSIKVNGTKKFIINTLLYILLGLALSIIFSWMKNRTIISADFLYFPISVAIIPLAEYFFEKKPK